MCPRLLVWAKGRMPRTPETLAPLPQMYRSTLSNVGQLVAAWGEAMVVSAGDFLAIPYTHTSPTRANK